MWPCGMCLVCRTDGPSCLEGVFLQLPRLIVCAFAVPRAEPPEPPPTVRRRAVLSFASAAFATVVRPSNLAVLAAVGVLWIVRERMWRELRRPAAAALILAAVCLPFLPQIAVNARAFGKPHPLITESLYSRQVGWGMSGLKYGGIVIPGEGARAALRQSPLSGEASPVEFAQRRPGAYLATLGLHLFAMFDHDFLFTYPTALRSWYRWPVSVLNYVFLVLVAAGVGVFVLRARRTEGGRRASLRRVRAALHRRRVSGALRSHARGVSIRGSGGDAADAVPGGRAGNGGELASRAALAFAGGRGPGGRALRRRLRAALVLDRRASGAARLSQPRTPPPGRGPMGA